MIEIDLRQNPRKSMAPSTQNLDQTPELTVPLAATTSMASPPFFLLLSVLLQTTTLSLSTTTFPGDIAALKTLKSSISPSSIPAFSCLASWDFSQDPCASFPCGLHCTVSNSNSSTFLRVAGISLDPAAYSGRLPVSLFSSLPFLAALSVSNNRFRGSLPAAVALPPALQVLDVSNNAFSGTIPSSLFSHSLALQELYLDHNFFSGEIPPQIGFLTTLTRLNLQSNNLAGGIPDMSSMRSLAYLDVSDNKLTGVFPAPGRLPSSLVAIVARNNCLAGQLPSAAVAAIPAARVLDLTNNKLSGAVPAAAFSHPALEQLMLGSNGFVSVDEPADHGASSTLVALDLSRNRLAGRLPGFIGLMPRLASVGLEQNRFTGSIPDQYAARVAGAAGEWVPFARLMLQGNYLCGTVPSQMRRVKEGSAAISLVDNCLLTCPRELFYCQGAPQKDAATCRVCKR